MAVAQAHQDFLGGGILPTLGFFSLVVDFEFFEENLTHLHGRGRVELLPRQLPALLLQRGGLGGKRLGIVGQSLYVDARPGYLHPCQHSHQRLLDVGEQMRHFLIGQSRIQHIGQL